MVKKFTIPFASQGDANDIPDALQVDGKVSFTQGFGYDYERPYDDPQAKDIAREDMNGLFKAITSAVGELQTLGASEWSNAIAYPKGAIVYFEKDLYISQVDDNQNKPPQNWVSITSIANDSLKKAANLSDLTNKATARSNLGLGSSATLNKTDVLGTSSNLVATQKLVNDTKINLESSKQDKLTFTGTGNVARMSEVDKKRDLIDFTFKNMHNAKLIIDNNSITTEIISFDDRSIWRLSDSSAVYNVFHPRKNGTIALTSDIPTITSSLGTSTTLVASQKLVNDVKQSGLGYGQSWVDVTSQRFVNTTYTNTTGKPIQIAIQSGSGETNIHKPIQVSPPNGEWVTVGFTGEGTDSEQVAVVIPSGWSYRINGSATIVTWAELR